MGVTHITMPCPWVFDRNYAALLAQMEYLSFVDVRRLAWVRPKAQSATGSMAIPSLVWNCCGGSARARARGRRVRVCMVAFR